MAGDIVVFDMVEELRAAGHEVISEAYSNDTNYRGTITKVNAWKADFCLEIHHDWSGAPDGAFGHWYRSDSKVYADAIQKAVGAAGFPLRPDWHKWRDDLSLLKETNMPSVLYEVGRIGQYSIGDLKLMGRSIARGIINLKGEDMTEAEVRAIMREEIDRVYNTALIEEAEIKLMNAGILNGLHAPNDAASVGLVMVMMARLLEKGVDLSDYELVKKT
jgi:hypothetical protein